MLCSVTSTIRQTHSSRFPKYTVDNEQTDVCWTKGTTRAKVAHPIVGRTCHCASSAFLRVIVKCLCVLEQDHEFEFF